MIAALTNVVSGLVIMSVAWCASDRRHGSWLLMTCWVLGCLGFAVGTTTLVGILFLGGAHG